MDRRLGHALALPLVALAWLPGGGCGGDLPIGSRVDKIRLLALRAEPPEIAPGATTLVSALVARPPAAQGAVSLLWLACKSSRTDGTAFGCLLAPGQRPEALPRCLDDPAAPLCHLGEALEVPYRAPAIDLGPSGVDERIVTLVAAEETAGGALACALGAAGNGGAPPDPDRCVIAFKRLTLSAAGRTPRPDCPGGVLNHNPLLDGVTLGGQPFPGPLAPRLLAPGAQRDQAALPLIATRADGADELRCCAATDSEAACPAKRHGRREVLLVSWFASAGSLKEANTSLQRADCDDPCQRQPLELTTATTWLPPTADEAAKQAPDRRIRIWAVVRDDRGGAAWLTADGTLTP